MKKLYDYKEEIHKCSKCGLCQSVCPVYGVTGNDCAVSRGKFIMLNGVIKGDLELNKNVGKYLDLCLKCNACKEFCPSGIDAREIFLAAKAQYFEKNPLSIFVRLVQSKALFGLILVVISLAAKVYRWFRLDKFVKIFYRRFLKFGFWGKKIILANEFLASAPQKRIKSVKNSKKSGKKVIYFKGCVNEFVNPRAKNAGIEILQRLGFEILDVKFECCGIPFLSSGNAEQFEKQAIFNLSQIPDDFDFFLTDCASCQSAFFEYEKILERPDLLDKIKRVNEKSLNITDFVLREIKNIEFASEKIITFHKPCHLTNFDFLESFLSKAKNIKFVEMKEFDKCCGFSGEFAIKNPLVSAEISRKKGKNVLGTNADVVITSCPACVLGLVQGLVENMETKHTKIPQVLNIIELIAAADLLD